MRKAVKYIITPLTISTAMISVQIESANAQINITSKDDYKAGEIQQILIQFHDSPYFKNQLQSAKDASEGGFADDDTRERYKYLNTLLSPTNSDNIAYKHLIQLLSEDWPEDLQNNLSELYKSLSGDSIEETAAFKAALEARYSKFMDDEVPATPENLTKYFKEYITPDQVLNNTKIILDYSTHQPKNAPSILQLQYTETAKIKDIITNERLKSDRWIDSWKAANGTTIVKRVQIEPKFTAYLKSQLLKDDSLSISDISAELKTPLKQEDIKPSTTIYDYLTADDDTELLTEDAKNKLEIEIDSNRQKELEDLKAIIAKDTNQDIDQIKTKIKPTEHATLETVFGYDIPEKIILEYHKKVAQLQHDQTEIYEKTYKYFTKSLKLQLSGNKDGNLTTLINALGAQFNTIKTARSTKSKVSGMSGTPPEVTKLKNDLVRLQAENEKLNKINNENELKLQTSHDATVITQLQGIIKSLVQQIKLDRPDKDEIYKKCGINASTKPIDIKGLPKPIIPIPHK